MRNGWMLGVGAALALVVAACGGNDDDTDASPTSFPTSTDPADRIPEDQRREMNLILASADVVVGPNNMAFAITGSDDEPVVADSVEVTWFYQVDGETFQPVMTSEAVRSEPGVGEEVVHVHADGSEHTHGGQDDNRVVYYARVEFEEPGAWGMLVQAEVDGEPVTANVGFQVAEDSALLMPGDEAYPSDNLTKDDVDDISEIDSGTVPNDMHDLTIRESIEAGRPVMVVFSTPAFCQTRFCGPVTDEVAELQDEYGDEVDFIHIEIWRDFQGQVLNNTAIEWLQREDGSLTEPWVYLIDGNGVVYDRWEGAMDRTVMEPSLQAVAGGATYGSN